MQSTPPPQHVLEISSGEARGEVHQRTTQEWIYHLGVIGFSFQLQDPHPRRTKQRHFFFATSLDPVGLHRSVGEEELQGQLRGERWISHDQIFAFGKDRWIGLGQLVKAHLELVPSVKWQEKRLPLNCKNASRPKPQWTPLWNCWEPRTSVFDGFWWCSNSRVHLSRVHLYERLTD